MCFRVARSFSDINEVEAPFDMSSFILDEIGLVDFSPFGFGCNMTTVAKYVSYQDLSEDG